MRGIIDFGSCQIYMQDLRCETIFKDGLSCVGTTGLGRPEQEASAEAMGYPITENGLSEMLCIHDACHTFVCQKMGLPFSPCLRMLAEKGQGQLTEEETKICQEEESIVGAFQTYLNTGRECEQLGLIPFDKDELVREFKALVKVNGHPYFG